MSQENTETPKDPMAEATKMGEVMGQAFLDKIAPVLNSEQKKVEEETTKSVEEKTVKVVSPYDSLGLTRSKTEEIIAKDFSPEQLGLLKGLQTDELLIQKKSALFFRAAIGIKMFPHEQAFYYTLKALSEGVDADGGYLVPAEFRGEVLRQLHHNGIMRPEVDVIPTTSDSIEFNSEDGRPTVTWGSENTSISTTTAGLAQTTINVHRMNALMYLSREVVADSNPAIMDWIRQEFVDAVLNEEDAVIIGGSGTGRPKGFTQISGFTSYAAGATLSFEDYNQLFHTLPVQYRRNGNAKWFMNDLTLLDAENIKDTQGRPIFIRDMSATTPGTLLGRPIVIHNNFPEGTIFFGDAKRTYKLLDRQQMSVETTTEGGETFQKHQVGLKVIERIGGDAIRKEAMVKGTGFSA